LLEGAGFTQIRPLREGLYLFIGILCRVFAVFGRREVESYLNLFTHSRWGMKKSFIRLGSISGLVGFSDEEVVIDVWSEYSIRSDRIEMSIILHWK